MNIYKFNKNHEKYNISTNMDYLILAGGCFWCVSKPYYEYDGVNKVLSGYTGGVKKFPTYEEVKSGTTGHKEAILIEYDSSIISFDKLLDIFFETIDPFDDQGQFIDRGDNYTCAIYTLNEMVKKYSQEKLACLEKTFNKKTYVPILPPCDFYIAEEYHQDFAINHVEEMEAELINSGRKTK